MYSLYRTKHPSRIMTSVAVLIAIIQLGDTSRVVAGTQIRDDAQYCWGNNVGWFNWRDANCGADGVFVHLKYLSGWIWAENVGWIHVGNGSPGDGVHYANEDETDFGVNVNPITGRLFGYAWGENIGWVNFDTSSLGAQAAWLDLCTKQFHGYAWAENIGWINLGEAERFVAAELETDCNTNGTEDECDLTDGGSQDCNTNGVPDECELDFDKDGLIDECDDDIDNDSVPNTVDACDFSPPDATVIKNPQNPVYATHRGTILGDLDGDCDCDLADFAILQQDITSPNMPPFGLPK